MKDFTPHTYSRLLKALIEQKYRFQTFEEYLSNPSKRSIVLRHDVDNSPQNSLILANIEAKLGLKGTFNFRAKPCSWNDTIIKEISALGHEIGYHYEEFSTYKGESLKAYETFKPNLNNLRKLAPVSTICMHGSPRSRYDSRDLWEIYNYRDLRIIGEPYFDVDFSKVLYLTDTGRRWDGQKVSVRDRVNETQNKKLVQKGYSIRTTNDIIKAAEMKALPETIMFTIHPQRWHCNRLLWLNELISQRLKNVAKRVLLEINR